MTHPVEETTGTQRSRDGLTLHYRIWRPEAPRASLTLAHGYAEHSGRYQAFGRFLAAHGVAVGALDQRGHGKSTGERANLRRFDEVVSDLADFDAKFGADLVQRWPTLPRFLMGHSVGGVVAAHLALTHPTRFRGLILSSPYLKNAVAVPGPLLALAGLLARVAPSLPTIKLDPKLLARNPEVGAAYLRDPLVYTGGTKARIGYEQLHAGAAVLARAAELTLPLLVLHGEADAIADAEGSRELVARSGSSDKTLRLYPGGYHELLNDDDHEEVWREILGWLETRLD